MGGKQLLNIDKSSSLTSDSHYDSEHMLELHQGQAK